ncbi:Ran-binding protein M homolog [Linum perenne]
MPTKLNTKTTDRIVVLPNKLSVKCEDVYGGAASVQANKPVPVNPKTRYYYFEMQYNSVGYDGNDGCIFVNGTNCYGSPRVTYEINDIVGAGIDYVSNEFFFTVKVNFGHKPFTYDIEAIYPCSCCQCLVNDDSESATTTDDDSKPSVGNEECWKKLMEKSETLLRKSIEEKEKELAKLKAVLNALSDNFQKYV